MLLIATYLLISDEAFIFLPECEATIRPADGKRLDNWMPFHLRDLIITARYLKIWNDRTFITHENDARQVCCHSKHHVHFAVRPGGQLALL